MCAPVKENELTYKSEKEEIIVFKIRYRTTRKYEKEIMQAELKLLSG
jgi:hypothetical protein